MVTYYIDGITFLGGSGGGQDDGEVRRMEVKQAFFEQREYTPTVEAFQGAQLTLRL